MHTGTGIYSMDWNAGMEWWNGLDWTGMEWNSGSCPTFDLNIQGGCMSSHVYVIYDYVQAALLGMLVDLNHECL